MFGSPTELFRTEKERNLRKVFVLYLRSRAKRKGGHVGHRLRQLIKSCNFNVSERDSLLRDRIVLGTTDRAARLRMFREKDLTLNLVIDMLRASEVTSSQIRTIDKSGSDESIQFAKRHAKCRKSPSDRKKCKYCLQFHQGGRDNCTAYGNQCQDCGVENHARGSMLCKKLDKPVPKGQRNGYKNARTL